MERQVILSERALLEEIWWAGVSRVQGYACVKTALENDQFQPTHIAAVGKAASSMIRSALDCCGKDLPSLMVTKYDHSEPDLSTYPNLKVLEAAHPVPDRPLRPRPRGARVASWPHDRVR